MQYGVRLVRKINGPCQWDDHIAGTLHAQKLLRLRHQQLVQATKPVERFKGSDQDILNTVRCLEHIIHYLGENSGPEFIHDGIMSIETDLEQPELEPMNTSED